MKTNTTRASSGNSALQCPRCFESYHHVSRMPKVLSCGHTICHLCLSQSFDGWKNRNRYSSANEPMKCPECNSSTKIQTELDLHNVPTNKALLNPHTTHNIGVKMENGTGNNQGLPVCCCRKDGNQCNNTAVYKCSTCKDTMGYWCGLHEMNTHRVESRFNDHICRRIDENSISANDSFCMSRHCQKCETQQYTRYCTVHDEALCTECALDHAVRDPKCDKVERILAVTTQRRSAVETLIDEYISKVSTVSAKNEECIDNIEHTFNDSRREIENALSEFEAVKIQLEEYAKQRIDDVKQKEQSVFIERSKVITSTSEELSLLRSEYHQFDRPELSENPSIIQPLRMLEHRLNHTLHAAVPHATLHMVNSDSACATIRSTGKKCVERIAEITNLTSKLMQDNSAHISLLQSPSTSSHANAFVNEQPSIQRAGIGKQTRNRKRKTNDRQNVDREGSTASSREHVNGLPHYSASTFSLSIARMDTHDESAGSMGDDAKDSLHSSSNLNGVHNSSVSSQPMSITSPEGLSIRDLQDHIYMNASTLGASFFYELMDKKYNIEWYYADDMQSFYPNAPRDNLKWHRENYNIDYYQRFRLGNDILSRSVVYACLTKSNDRRNKPTYKYAIAIGVKNHTKDDKEELFQALRLKPIKTMKNSDMDTIIDIIKGSTVNLREVIKRDFVTPIQPQSMEFNKLRDEAFRNLLSSNKLDSSSLISLVKWFEDNECRVYHLHGLIYGNGEEECNEGWNCEKFEELRKSNWNLSDDFLSRSIGQMALLKVANEEHNQTSYQISFALLVYRHTKSDLNQIRKEVDKSAKADVVDINGLARLTAYLSDDTIYGDDIKMRAPLTLFKYDMLVSRHNRFPHSDMSFDHHYQRFPRYQHTKHKHVLQFKDSVWGECNVCSKEKDDIFYGCSECDWDSCISCVKKDYNLA